MPIASLINSRSEPLLHDLAENSDRSVGSANSRRSYTRAQSDPGRNTPGIEAGDTASSDGTKSETAAPGLEASERLSSRPMSAEKPTLPLLQTTAGSTGDTDQPTPIFAGVERPDAAQLAKQLAEANEHLSRWQTWALNNGIQAIPPHGFMAEGAGPILLPTTQTVSKLMVEGREGG